MPNKQTAIESQWLKGYYMNPIIVTYAATALTYVFNEVIVKNTKAKVGLDEWDQMTIDKQIIACATYVAETVNSVRDSIREGAKPKES